MNIDLNSVYDQLDKISVHIEPRSIPNPRYISEKIGECHVCIERVEKFYIQANRELSLYQIAMNNALASFEYNRNQLISSDPEISTLPSDRTKEAKANTRLKDQIDELSNYKRDIQSLETLVKTISVKLKNLSRLNGDIRLQMRIMESQIKLGTGDINDPTTKNLMDELKKTVLGQDVWEGADTKSEDNLTVDPTKPIDSKNLGLDPMEDFLKTVEDVISVPEPDKTTSDIIISVPEPQSTTQVLVISTPESSSTMLDINTLPELKDLSAPYSNPIEPFTLKETTNDFSDLLSNIAPAVNNLPKQEEVVSTVNTLPKQEESSPKNIEEIIIEEEDDTEILPEDDIFAPGSPEAETSESQSSVDLDKVLDFNSNPGGEQEQKKEEIIITESEEQKVTQKDEQKNPNEMSFENLLGQFK